MVRNTLIKRTAVALTCCGLLGTSTAAWADGPRVTKTTAAAKQPVVTDVAMKNGSLKGQVMDAQGRPVDGAAVSVKLAGREIAKTVTNKQGQFAVTNLRTGTYEVSTPQAQGYYRFWSEKTAPPSAKAQLLLVQDTKVARGQGMIGPDPLTLLTLGAAVTGAVLGGINQGDLNDLQDDADALQNQNAALQQQVNDLQDSVDQLLQSP